MDLCLLTRYSAWSVSLEGGSDPARHLPGVGYAEEWGVPCETLAPGLWFLLGTRVRGPGDASAAMELVCVCTPCTMCNTTRVTMLVHFLLPVCGAGG